MYVFAGDVQIGGGAPVSIQSMTNTDTRDTTKTLEQIQRLCSSGCDIVRLSVYDDQCAKAFKFYKSKVKIPLVADIHFDYRLAISAAQYGADKLRINPGNIGGSENIRRLADCAREHGIPIRIGVNSGSLEKELLNKHGGPTPEAMLESAINHARMLEDMNFGDIVLSLKASNVHDSVKAYRLARENTAYPLHIGITEAGVGENAIIKSAVGLGALLLDGIGDTIRVSITGDPVDEVEAAKSILRATGHRAEGAELISCPTCGRCKVNLIEIAKELDKKLKRSGPPFTVAVMGCAVNGPGEAKAADIGIAFGENNAVLFKRGQKYNSGEPQQMIEMLIKEIQILQG